jgi:hypothetical protein
VGAWGRGLVIRVEDRAVACREWGSSVPRVSDSGAEGGRLVEIRVVAANRESDERSASRASSAIFAESPADRCLEFAVASGPLGWVQLVEGRGLLFRIGTGLLEPGLLVGDKTGRRRGHGRCARAKHYDQSCTGTLSTQKVDPRCGQSAERA